jgi:chemotaxis protein histidine kinase CheA
MKSIESGVIRKLSPSMMDCFDDTTPFGCQRRFVFRYVYGYKEPMNETLGDGVALHEMNKVYLQDNKLLISVQKYTDWFNAGKSYLDSIRPRIVAVEADVRMLVAGIPIHEMSKCDVVMNDGIIDWKTTSSISKWGKTPGQLAKNNQLVIYAKAFHPDLDKIVLVHGQYQTKDKVLFKTATVEVSREELDAHYEKVILPLVDRMKEVAKTGATEAELKAVKPNRNACRLNTKNACPHAALCPPDKENALMNLFNKYKAPGTESAPPPAAQTPSGPAVLPPDAPKSDPALAAKPVEGFSPVPPPKTEEEKAKRRMLIVDVAPTPASTPAAPAAEPVDAEEAAALAALAAIKEKKAKAAEAAKKAAEEAAALAAKKAEEQKNAAPATTEGAAETEAEKKARGPGRPPGRKNNRTLAEEAGEGIGSGSVRVAYGVTMGIGGPKSFEFVRIDVEFSEKHAAGEAEATYERVLDKAKACIEAEMLKVKAAQPTLNPGAPS